jgi:hypothetical protein
MSNDRRTFLSRVMSLAWRKVRWERNALRRPYSLSEALRHAWAWFKGEAARTAQQAACAASWGATGGTVTHLRSTVRSPIDRSLLGRRYGKTDAYRASYTTARLGC